MVKLQLWWVGWACVEETCIFYSMESRPDGGLSIQLLKAEEDKKTIGNYLKRFRGE